MKGYLLLIAMMISSWTLSTGASLTNSQQSDKLITELTTEFFHYGLIVIYQDYQSTTLEISDVGTAVGTLVDSEGKVVWTDQFETPKNLVFEHSRYDEGLYGFILEKPDGTFLELASFEIKY